MAAYGAAEGLPQAEVCKLLAATTTEDALVVLQQAGLQEKVCQRLAERASLRAERYLFQKLKVGTVMVTLAGELLGMDATAREIGEGFGWKLPQ